MDRARKLGPNPTQPSPSREMTLPFLFFSFPFTLFHIPRSVLFFFWKKSSCLSRHVARCVAVPFRRFFVLIAVAVCHVGPVLNFFPFCPSRFREITCLPRVAFFLLPRLAFPFRARKKKKKKTFPNSQQNPPKPRARRASHTTRPIAIQSTSSHGERRRRRAARGQRAEDGGGRDRRPRPRLVHHGVRVQALPRPPPRRAHPQHRPRARPRRGELRCPGGQGRRGARRGGGPGGGGRGQGGGAGGEGGRGRHDRVEEEEEGDVTFPTGSATKICCELCFVLPNLVLNDAKFSILIPLSAPVVLISAYLCACVSF